MTNERQEQLSPRDIEAQAVEWLIARDETQEWSEEKQAAFDAWLLASPAHMMAFWRVEASWLRTNLIADVRPFGVALHPQQRRKSWLGSFRVAAAAAVIAVVGAGAFSYLSRPDLQTFATAVGGHKIITLLDGSQIELNTNTVIQIGLGEKQRSVRLLRGEAYFDVHHDAAHPFTVVASGHRLTDLGTKFTMQVQGPGVRVALLEGRASIELNNSERQRPTILRPGDVAVANQATTTVSRLPDSRLQENIAWRKGILVFDNTSLSDAAKEFNRYNTVRISLEGVDGTKFRINGAIRVDDREEFARLARHFFGLRVDERAQETIIRR